MLVVGGLVDGEWADGGGQQVVQVCERREMRIVVLDGTARVCCSEQSVGQTSGGASCAWMAAGQEREETGFVGWRKGSREAEQLCERRRFRSHDVTARAEGAVDDVNGCRHVYFCRE